MDAAIWIFARETCLSQGDLLRLTFDMIDEQRGTITPSGSRKKTRVEQVSPLTPEARKILDEIAEKKSGVIVANLQGLVFTLNDGTPITPGLIHSQVHRAISQTGVKKFVFHNLRNTRTDRMGAQGNTGRRGDESERSRISPDAQNLCRSPSG